jgi:hypothetical protein
MLAQSHAKRGYEMSELRRDFLKSLTQVGVLGALGETNAFLKLSPLWAADARVTPELVRLSPEIEPLVRLIEQTPREKCFEMMADQLRRGCSYRQFLGALFLAGIRNVNPQPPGFKFHCVFVIHSAHQLSLDAPAEERLLPLLWALDNFKESQQRDVAEGDFHLGPVRGKLPSAGQAWEELHQAMESWDEERADRAITALVRSRGAHEVIDGLWRYGARDYRNIGHKAIFVANSWRTLQTIGWQHAEPALRSLILGLLDFGVEERLNGYAFQDQCYLSNLGRARQAVTKLPPEWAEPGIGGADAAKQILAGIREAKTEEACRGAVDLLLKGEARAPSIWDAAHLASGELIMRMPGILGVHAVTSVNALHYAFRVAGSAETRLLLLLQGVGWMSQFANFMAQSDNFGNTNITEVEGADIPASPEEATEEILALVSSDRAGAARKAFRYAEKHPEPNGFQRAARSLIFAKGQDVHAYKYAAAIFEDYGLVDPAWRPHMLATAVYNLRGSQLPDSTLMQRARDVVRPLKA